MVLADIVEDRDLFIVSTAFDLAGTGRARAGSLLAATRLAADLAARTEGQESP